MTDMTHDEFSRHHYLTDDQFLRIVETEADLGNVVDPTRLSYWSLSRSKLIGLFREDAPFRVYDLDSIRVAVEHGDDFRFGIRRTDDRKLGGRTFELVDANDPTTVVLIRERGRAVLIHLQHRDLGFSERLPTALSVGEAIQTAVQFLHG